MLTLQQIDQVGVASRKTAAAAEKFEQAKQEFNTSLAELDAALAPLRNQPDSQPENDN